MRLVAAVEDGAIARRILEHIGLPARAPPRGPPWRRQQQLAVDEGANRFDGVDPPAFAE
jgi:hypothetical protein